MRTSAAYRLRALLVAASMSIMAGGCATMSPEAASPGVTPSTAAPEPREIIHLLLLNTDVPLIVDPSCHKAGTHPDDRTIGEYISGFIAALDNPEAQNLIETTILDDPSIPEALVWRARVMIGHSYGEEVWRWGVEFLIRKDSRSVLRDSFRCLGSG
ncbi:hypothetical protein [Thauera butanivorans]|uniref:hypothetical protein n=1 Tax=Thauera butanivorans TaxID=86174 RepID=UPI00083816E7|nr:hypothetical protein [Thauera butanivorans]